MATRPKMAVGEWYHCYTRGVDKRRIFESSTDFDRFLTHIHVGNNVKNYKVSDLSDTRFLSVLSNPLFADAEQLVELGVYALMPNHLHFLIKEIREGGIARFMQKVFTGYTKYFNNKNDRTGSLFSGTYKSKHVYDDRYLKQVTPYILLNPLELFEPNWKEGGVSLPKVEKELLGYEYSSLPIFLGQQLPESVLIGDSLKDYYDSVPSLAEMIEAAQEFIVEHDPQV